MKLVFGLGNPGKEYENSIHNAGFLALDRLSRLLSFTDFNRHKGALASEGRVGAEKVLLVKPQTFMNLSGKCVLELAAFYKVEETDIIVLYDDVDLDLGAVRIRARGSAGTHNGMRSIIGEISTQNFPRIRIGAGRPPKG
ncbi:MAG: aminoacyl-tRNA hydrolase [Clostridiales bacterium]|nr:aminoacyl-tRNA hydrolase [Clostridiales bacterium]